MYTTHSDITCLSQPPLFCLAPLPTFPTLNKSIVLLLFAWDQPSVIRDTCMTIDVELTLEPGGLGIFTTEDNVSLSYNVPQ